MAYLRVAVVPFLMVLAGAPVLAAEKPVAAPATPASPTAPAAPVPDGELIAIRLFNGLEYEGIVQKESDEKDLELLTVYGTLTFHRSDIVRTRKELSETEKASIRVAIRDADAHRRLTDERRAARGERTRDVEAPRNLARSEDPVARIPLSVPQFTQSESWMERMDRQLNKRLTLDLTDDSLNDTVALIANITGLNIIVNPKVAQANPKINLRVKEMDAGTAIRWITQLTETYAEVKDHAIYITDKPSQDNADAEKQQAMIMAATVGANIELPADGTPLTDDDRLKIAKAILEKEMPKVHDFPGPDMGLGTLRESNNTPFAPAP